MQAVRRLQASFAAYRKEATRLADDFAGTLADTLLQAVPPDNGRGEHNAMSLRKTAKLTTNPVRVVYST